jgi:hypothetical protein
VAAAVGWSGIASNHDRLKLDFVAGEIWTGNYLWGYTFTAIAVALVPLGLLAYERGRSGSARLLAAAAAAGLFCSWLQPWQGATFALVVASSEALLALRGRWLGAAHALRSAVPVLLAAALPLVYYLILSHADRAWELAGTANDVGHLPLWAMFLCLAPLAIPALFAYRDPAPDFGSVGLRIWPFAALAVFYLPAGTFAAHALQGLTIPLAVLAVLALRGWLGERPLTPLLGVSIAAILVLPGLAYRVDQLRGAVKQGLQPYFLEPGEHDALRQLERLPEDGGVLTTFFSGQAIPAYTGRPTWIGASSWTPNFKARKIAADRLFAGELNPIEAERLVRRSGVRFLYSDCQGHPDITGIVGSFTEPPVRFGCATLYRVR